MTDVGKLYKKKARYNKQGEIPVYLKINFIDGSPVCVNPIYVCK